MHEVSSLLSVPVDRHHRKIYELLHHPFASFPKDIRQSTDDHVLMKHLCIERLSQLAYAVWTLRINHCRGSCDDDLRFWILQKDLNRSCDICHGVVHRISHALLYVCLRGQVIQHVAFRYLHFENVLTVLEIHKRTDHFVFVILWPIEGVECLYEVLPYEPVATCYDDVLFHKLGGC